MPIDVSNVMIDAAGPTRIGYKWRWQTRVDRANGETLEKSTGR